VEVNNLTSSLKGDTVRDKGGSNAAADELEGGARIAAHEAALNSSERLADPSPDSLSGVRWRVAQLGRQIDAQRRLVIFRGYARAPDGRLQAQQIRAMLDSGAQAEIISPQLAKQLGGTITEGRFGVAVEAFGGETQLTQQARGIQLQLPGTNPRSLLAQDFTASWNFIVSPQPLNARYDMLLGVQFMRRFRLSMSFQGPCVIRLTADNGSETMVTEDAEEHIEAESDSQVTPVLTHQREQPAQPRRLTQSQRRAMRREWRDSEELRQQQAARAAADPSMKSTVMSMDELEQLWATSAPGSVKIFVLQSRGFVEGVKAETVQVGAVNHVQQTDKNVTSAGGGGCESDDPDASLLPMHERTRATNVVSDLHREYADVFPDELPAGVPPARGVEPFRIDLKEGTKPFGRYGPRMTEANTQAAGKMLQELLAKGFIRPSRSPWGSPMFLVDKPDGGKRMVIDYRGLNAATTRNRYPLPRIDELFDQLQGARYFSKLDLRTGYWQIRVAAEDVPKTAFTSRHGHFEWLVLPMGLTNAPAEFMALMENTFREELNKFVVVFLDDILVYSQTLEEHEQHLRVVLQRLREQKLFAKWSKCTFMRQEVEFLGHFVGRAGVRMVEGKVAAVERWPTPSSQKEVEQFLGLAGYYRRFIADFSKIAAPLSELCGTLKKVKGGGAKRSPPTKRFEWGERQQQAFDALKVAVTSAPCLAIPDPQRDFLVHTDASGYATGAVLMQRFENGLRPIAFLSKKMSAAERRYPVHEQELLAILNALKAWRHYLGGRRFTVLTDHQSLQYVETSAMATPRQMRWAAWLSEFDFTIRYGRGKDNVAADALSRAAAGVPGPNDVSRDTNVVGQGHSRSMIASLDNCDTHAKDIYVHARLLINAINELAPLPVRIRDAARDDQQYQSLLGKSSKELAAQRMVRQRGLLYRVAGGNVTPVLRDAAPAEDAPPGPAAGAADMNNDKDDNNSINVDRDVNNNIANHIHTDGQLVVPNSAALRTWLLSSAHDTLLGAHHSATTTNAWLRERVWWSGMAEDAARYVRGCELCQRNKPDVRGRQGLPLSIATPMRAWEVICLDFIGPLPRTARGHDMVMVVIEKLTRWVYYISMRKTDTGQDVFALLDRFVLANHDTPRQIISDRDSRFTSHFWEGMWAALRTQLKRSTAFHPQTDGSTERANRTLIEQLRSHVDEHQADWDILLPQLQRANNTAVCVTTGYTPFEMNYGRRVQTELDAELEAEDAVLQQQQPAVAAYPGAEELARRREQVEADARQRIERAQQKQRKDAERGRRMPDIAAGDRVWLSNRNMRLDGQGRVRKLEPLYCGPYEVMELHGSNAAKLRLPVGCRLHPVFNLDLLRKHVDGKTEFPSRPIRDARPGPVQIPEEDKQAGGPDEPEYEVEAIIGSRGRGVRMSYKVKWLGWPIEQASWCPAAECRITCPERVREFEERELRRLQAVQVIREVEVGRREQRVGWIIQNGMRQLQQVGGTASAGGGAAAAAVDDQQLAAVDKIQMKILRVSAVTVHEAVQSQRVLSLSSMGTDIDEVPASSAGAAAIAADRVLCTAGVRVHAGVAEGQQRVAGVAQQQRSAISSLRVRYPTASVGSTASPIQQARGAALLTRAAADSCSVSGKFESVSCLSVTENKTQEQQRQNKNTHSHVAKTGGEQFQVLVHCSNACNKNEKSALQFSLKSLEDARAVKGTERDTNICSVCFSESTKPESGRHPQRVTLEVQGEQLSGRAKGDKIQFSRRGSGEARGEIQGVCKLLSAVNMSTTVADHMQDSNRHIPCVSITPHTHMGAKQLICTIDKYEMESECRPVFSRGGQSYMHNNGGASKKQGSAIISGSSIPLMHSSPKESGVLRIAACVPMQVREAGRWSRSEAIAVKLAGQVGSAPTMMINEVSGGTDMTGTRHTFILIILPTAAAATGLILADSECSARVQPQQKQCPISTVMMQASRAEGVERSGSTASSCWSDAQSHTQQRRADGRWDAAHIYNDIETHQQAAQRGDMSGRSHSG
jgi:hypothetical protein